MEKIHLVATLATFSLVFVYSAICDYKRDNIRDAKLLSYLAVSLGLLSIGLLVLI